MQITVNDQYCLSEINEGDLESYLKYYDDSSIHDNFVANLLPYSEEKFQQYLGYISKQHEKYERVMNYGIRKSSGELIGAIEMSSATPHMVTIAYWIGRDYWGQGIMTKVVKSFVDYLIRDCGIVRVQADVLTFNQGSASVLKKVGFRHEGTMRKRYCRNGQYLDSDLFSFVI